MFGITDNNTHYTTSTMFPINHMMGARQSRGNNRCQSSPFPYFVDVGPEPYFHGPFGPVGPCRSGSGSTSNWQREAPGVQHLAGLCNPFTQILLQNLRGHAEDSKSHEDTSDERGNGCNKTQNLNGQHRGNKIDKEKQKGAESHPTLHDIINHVMSASPDGVGNRKWQQRVDCRGFEPRNIKVKIEGEELLVKAFRKQESEDGVRTMSVRKAVQFPDNVDTKKIKCKFSHSGFMIIEAPYLEANSENDSNDFVKELIASVLPALDQFVHTMHAFTNDAEAKKEKDIETCNENQTEGNEKKENDLFESVEAEEKERSTQKEENDNGNTHTRDLETETNQNNGDETEDQLVLGQEPSAPSSSEDMISDDDVEVQTENLDSTPEKVDKTPEPIIAFPADDTQSPKQEDEVDNVSNASSEDSFVLLSELNKENAETREEEQESQLDLKSTKENKSSTMDSTNGSIKPLNAQSEAGTSESIIETDSTLFRLDMPSYNPEFTSVTFDNTNRLLTISASKNRRGSRRPSDTITKTMVVADDVDVNGLQCFYRDGTLTVTAPRKNDIRHIPIDIKV